MSLFRPVMAAPVIVLLMGSVAHAALTADQLWAEWKEAAAGIGLTLEAATELSDAGALTLNGVSLKAPDGSATLTVSEMLLTGEDDGSVTIEPGDIALSIAEAGAGTFEIAHEGLAVNVAEGEVGRDYGVAADMLSFVFAGEMAPALPPADGQQAVPATVAGTVMLNGFEGGYGVAAGDNQVAGLALSAASLTYDVTNTDASVGVDSVQKSETKDIALTGELTLPATMALMAINSPEAFKAALAEGLAFAIEADQGVSTGTMTDKNPMMPMDITFSAGAGRTEASGDITGVSIFTAGESLEMSVKSPMIPVPEVKLTSGPIETGFDIPLVAVDEPGDYGLLMKLTGLTVNEEVWSLIDPGKTLPRDPANLTIDVGGQVKMDVLALAAAESAGMVQVTPPEPLSLDVREIALSIAGAAFSGKGAFTFDNSAVAQGGAPVPVGTADVTLSGGNRLIDGLIATGLVSEEDAMGARMMMGAFMTPGEGDDVLTSAIEAKADGQILVNGQRVQ